MTRGDNKELNQQLKELRNKPQYDYKKVRNLTVPYRGKKIKFRTLVADMAKALTRYNALSYKGNRVCLLNEFRNGGLIQMNEYYVQELQKGIQNQIDGMKL